MSGSAAGAAAGTPLRDARYARYVLGVLLVVYIFNFIDRIILGVLAPLIKAELQFSDTQLGLLGGTAFALFYTALGVPIGWLADRRGRVWIMTTALAVWSAFTAVCGLAQSFVQLFLARVGVGVGEAGGVAPAYSLIADYFPPGQRARALAVYAFGIPIGSATGLLFGGYIAARVNWRVAFIVVGLAGLLLTPLLRLTVREPPRGGLDPAASVVPATPAAVLRHLAGKPAFWGVSLAAASSSIMGYGLLFWMPSFLVRSYHLSLSQAAAQLGAIILVGGSAGVWLGGWLADRIGRHNRAAYALIPAASLLLSVPFYVAGVWLKPPGWGIAWFLVPTALGLTWLGPLTSAVQQLVPASMRTTASAILLFIVNLIGLGVGAVVIGALSDRLTFRYGPDGLGYAILAGNSFYVVGAALLALSARRLARDWEG